MMPNNAPAHLNDKLNLETARISWHELQPHFARGATVYVAPTLDLVNIAHMMAADNSTAIAPLLREGQIALVTEVQAQQFWQDNTTMWAVVVAPWVLVQAAQNNVSIGAI